MFAVIKTGGRQYRVAPDDVLEIGKIAGDVGTIVQLGEVLVLGGDTPVLGFPTISGASDEPREKLTTTALEEVRNGTAKFHLTQRRRPNDLP